jgi:hypothetical protein
LIITSVHIDYAALAALPRVLATRGRYDLLVGHCLYVDLGRVYDIPGLAFAALAKLMLQLSLN